MKNSTPIEHWIQSSAQSKKSFSFSFIQYNSKLLKILIITVAVLDGEMGCDSPIHINCKNIPAIELPRTRQPNVGSLRENCQQQNSPTSWFGCMTTSNVMPRLVIFLVGGPETKLSLLQKVIFL